jgi:predicted neutral ceramidase superfamily lipid hydrolase
MAILATLGSIFLRYSRNKDVKKLLVSLGSLILIIALGIMGNLTRQVMPLFLLHVVLIVLAWGGLLLYLFRERYLWWVIFSPVVTIVLFLLLEFLAGSGHEGVI